jgi:hypothetical protein
MAGFNLITEALGSTSRRQPRKRLLNLNGSSAFSATFRGGTRPSFHHRNKSRSNYRPCFPLQTIRLFRRGHSRSCLAQGKIETSPLPTIHSRCHACEPKLHEDQTLGIEKTDFALVKCRSLYARLPNIKECCSEEIMEETTPIHNASFTRHDETSLAGVTIPPSPGQLSERTPKQVFRDHEAASKLTTR